MAREALPRLASNLPRRGDADVVVLGLHGGIGEDGTIQSMLELTGVPYTGSHTLGSALAMDKDLSKALFLQAGVTTADWLMAPATASEVGSRIGYPAIVKPSKQGSTVGLSVVKEPGALSAAIDEAADFDDEVMIERFIPGRELTVGILGGEALPVGEIIPSTRFTTTSASTRRGWPWRIFRRSSVRKRRRGAGVGSEGVSRAQAPRVCTHRFPNVERQHVLLSRGEHAAGHDATSLIPQAAAAAGITFPELCERIVRIALDARGAGRIDSWASRRSDRCSRWRPRRPSGAGRVVGPPSTLRAIRRRSRDRDDVHCRRARDGDQARDVAISFHSISISGRDPLANVEYLSLRIRRSGRRFPVMLDCDGQRPGRFNSFEEVRRLTQVTLEARRSTATTSVRSHAARRPRTRNATCARAECRGRHDGRPPVSDRWSGRASRAAPTQIVIHPTAAIRSIAIDDG